MTTVNRQGNALRFENKPKPREDKPKTPTCKDCLNYATCPERSRLYPCREFKPIRVKKE